MKITLTSHEMYLAANTGIIRQITNLKNGLKDRYGAETQKGWDIHIEGCGGELAVAKHFNLFWTGNIGNLSLADVGNIQVRTTSWDTGRLIIHPKDKDDDIFILVTGAMPTYTIQGYMTAKEAKQDQWWEDPRRQNRWAYFIPQKSLHQISEINLSAALTQREI